MQRFTTRETFILSNASKKMLVILLFMIIITITSFIQLIVVDHLRGNIWIEGDQSECMLYTPCPVTDKSYKCYLCAGKDVFKLKDSIIAADTVIFTISFIFVVLLSCYCACCNCCKQCITPTIISNDVNLVEQSEV